MTGFLAAFAFQAGYNAALVTLGAIMLGIAAGTCGSFLNLRKRALVADGIAHATLPGIVLAFIAMVWLGGDGRNLAGLLAGSALSAGLGLLVIDWITRRTRLHEDAAIGAVLSVFFGFGVVLLTLIQTMPSGKQAGLQSFLLGSTAGMLFQDAIIIACGGALAVLLALLLRRPFTLIAFDADYAAVRGVNLKRMDLALMALVTGVTLIGLKLVGLILIVALLIIPPVAARFWSNRSEGVAAIAALFGGLSAWIGSAISASVPQVPTGPIIVLIAFGFFVASLIFGTARGLLWQVLSSRVPFRQEQG